MNQEWLASVLCVVHRAMAREARLHAMLERIKQDRSLHLRLLREVREEYYRHIAHNQRDEVSQLFTATAAQIDCVAGLIRQARA